MDVNSFGAVSFEVKLLESKGREEEHFILPRLFASSRPY